MVEIKKGIRGGLSGTLVETHWRCKDIIKSSSREG